MESIYLQIAQKFKDNEQVFIDRNLPPVRQVDIYMGQPDDAESFEVFCPSVFVDWTINEDENTGTNYMQLDFHVLQEPGAGTEHYSDRLTEGMEYLQMLKTVKYLVNKLSADNTTPLKYMGERPRITPFFKYHIVSYKCYIDEDQDSINRPTYEDVELTDYHLEQARLKQKKETPEPPIIDTFKTRSL
ncbi:hypothetical protein [Carboxylicivirga linearis]|uniref:Uncharacterized protein n=1 Tax=Carboxylicivirga linearis TaxID=1628157 RepID=A0ABS5K0J0_9BACT|nr:hypothetical protein [Carboxylicivirga linearis]MBS2100695.1 hypothetical protein [Carboxylicivirga linearis]